LITDEFQDPNELNNGSNGLEVKGRGGNHQADVLGELNWIPAFTNPVRLIIEAKHRKDPAYIDVIREAVGVLNDVNNKYNFKTGEKLPPKQYNYVYSVFSASGFSKGAVDYGLAHQISLIDMSIEDYGDLLSAVDNISIELLELESEYNRGNFLKGTRGSIREVLNTVPEGREESQYFSDDHMKEIIHDRVEPIKKYKELFIGMTTGSFILLIKAENPEDFLEYASNNPEHKIRINWSWEDNGAIWKISPLNPPSDESKYILKFKLPKKLHKWIYESEKEKAEAENRALGVKKSFFSNITIYRYHEGIPKIFKLKYNPMQWDIPEGR